MIFECCDDAWLPTYGTVLARQEGEQGQAVDWSRYGWDAIVVPSDCPTIAERMNNLGERFGLRYFDRMLGYETLELWQVKLQERFDQVVHPYERAYRLYSQHADAMDSDVVPGRKIVTNDKTQASGSDARTGTSKQSDTPSSAINESDDYAGSIAKDSSKTEYGRADTRDSTTVESVTGGVLLDNINSSIDGFRDLDTAFISEFQNLFLKVWWY